jgi:GDP-4-dehydro-6-deoxy-D-mannose reductase
VTETPAGGMGAIRAAPRRVLVTGAAGFVGQWLLRELLGAGWEVAGTRFGDVVPSGALTLEERRRGRWIPADLREPAAITTALDAVRPDAVIHLAAISFSPDAQKAPMDAVRLNVGVAAQLFATLRERRATGGIDPVVLVIGSSEEYGRHDESEMPLGEDAELRPLNLYGATKLAQEILAQQAYRADGIRVILTRSFNHSGPGQQPQFVLPALVRRAMALRKEWNGVLGLGSTSPVRDFLHVADVARAYMLLLDRGTPGEVYNVCSGEGIDIAALARRVLAHVGADARLETDPALVRPVEIPALVGDATKLREATGWSPTRSLDTLIEDLIRAASH